MKENTQGFTMVELIAVVIIMAVLSLVAFTSYNAIIKRTEINNEKEIVRNLVMEANILYNDYVLQNKQDQLTNVNIYSMMSTEDMPETGILIINDFGDVSIVTTIDDRCYKKEYDSNQVNLVTEEECSIDYSQTDKVGPIVDLEIIGIETNGWYSKETYVKVTAKDLESGVLKYKWCQGLDCTPITEEEPNRLITVTDTTGSKICVVAVDLAGNASDKVCTNVIKVDTVSPEFTGVSDVVIWLNETVDLTEGISVSDAVSGVISSASYEINPEQVDTSTVGTKEVKYTAKDIAGNERTITRKIIVESNSPIVEFVVSEGVINEYGYANEQFYVTINVIDNSNIGIKQFSVCTTDEDTCVPSTGSTITNSLTTTREIFTEGNNNRICVQVTDNNEKLYDSICSTTYKLDMTKPTVGTILVNDESVSSDWYTENLTITAVNGTDSLSGHLSTSVEPTSIIEDTTGKLVTVTTIDKAGNADTRQYTLKLDKTEPTVEISKSNNTTLLTASVTPSTTESNYSFQWYKESNLIDGATSSTYTPSEAGTYKVVVTTGANKSATSNSVSISGYTITYDMNGGDCTVASQTKVQDIAIILSTPSSTCRSGYNFVGWGISANDKTADYEAGDAYIANEGTTLYAIWKKTLIAKVDDNGTTLSSTNDLSCEIYNAEESCTVDAPSITREGFTIIGFNTSASSTTNNSAYSTSTKKITLTLSNTGSTWYAITKKDVTVTFYRNGATSITPNGGSASTATSLTQKCTIWNSATSCNITSPTITASTNTPAVVGWATSADATSSAWGEDAEKTFSSDASYYAITKKDAVTLTATFVGNGATLTGNAVLECTIAATYNGNEQSKSCTVTAPTITRAGYIVVGFNSSQTATTSEVNSGATVTLSSDKTYYAITKEVVLNLTSTSGTTYVGGSSLTTKVDTETSKNYGSISCSSSNDNIAKCTVSGTSITITPGSTAGSAVITVTESNVNKTATYTFNNKSNSFAINATFTADDANYYKDDAVKYWLNESYYVNVTVTSDSSISKIEMCTDITDTCDPTGKATVNSTTGSMEIVQESNNNRVCVQAIDNLGRVSSPVCSEAFGLDKTDPTAGTILVNNANPSTGWYNTTLTITKVDGTDSLSGHLSTSVDTTSITSSTSGKVVTVTTKDKAGNTSTRPYTLKTDITEPTVSITKDVSTTKLTSSVTPSTTTSNYTYQWYKGSSAISGATSSTYTPTQAGTYKVVVTTGAGKTDTSNTITINSYTVSYNLNGGTCTIASQTKVQDIAITLATPATNCRSGYEFIGWGTSATDTSKDYDAAATYTSNSSIELFAIWKKTLTASFNANGASLSSTTAKSCDIYNAQESCTVDAPTITRDGFTITGFNTSANSTTNNSAYSSSTKKITLTSSNTGSTWYAVTKKDVTVTFYRNGATSITPKNGSASTAASITQTCTIQNTAASCSVTSPTITASTNTPSVVGWATSADATSSSWTAGEEKTFTSNASYYAITKKNAVTLTASYNANGASLSSTTTANTQCTIAATYNGNAQSTSCTVTAPTISRSGYTIVGFNTSASSTTNNSAYSSSTKKITLNSSNTGSTWYAVTKKEAITLKANFNANGASLSSTSQQTCTLAAVYNTNTQDTSCTVTAPTITRSGYTIIGFNTSASSTTNNSAYSSSTGKITLTSSNTGSTWYAVTKKEAVTYTATYVANGATLTATSYTDSATSDSCTIAAVYNTTTQATSCTVQAPEITRSGYEVVGFNESSTATTSQVASEGSISISSNKTYYAITKQITITLSPTSGTVKVGSSTTSTITSSNAGTLSCSSSNNSVATCTVSGSTLTVTGVATGTATITVKGTNGGPTPTYSVTVESSYICRRATELHTETCSSVYNYGCRVAGYSSGDIITYGNTSVTSGVLTSGDAFDCDVDGSGTYDDDERFYYVSDYEFDSNYAVLVYYSNTKAGVAENTSAGTTAYDSANRNLGPNTAVVNLPKTNQWSNVSLVNTTRYIRNQKGELPTTGGIFNYSGYAARLMTTQEVDSACGITSGSTVTGELDKCNYLMENTYYSNSNYMLGYWLETRISTTVYNVFNVHTSMRRVGSSSANTTGYYGVRPVIEVPKSDIDYK